MRDVEEKLQALAEQIRSLSRMVEESKRSSDLPLVLSYKRAARELDISVPTLKRMIARGQIRPVGRGDGVGISRSAILRIAGEEPERSRARQQRSKGPTGSSDPEKIRAALREAKRNGN